MVALNTDYAPSKTSTRSQNRVGDFFCEAGQGAEENRLASRIGTKEKTSYSYETASGLPVWPSRDPYGESGGLNIYAMVGNDPVNWYDAIGLYPGSPGHGNFISPSDSSALITTLVQDFDQRRSGLLGALSTRKVFANAYNRLMIWKNAGRLSDLANPDVLGFKAKNRFVYTCKYGWLDHGHFFNNAYFTYLSSNKRLVEIIATAFEGAQNSRGFEFLDPSSAWTPEDLISNKLGRDFGKRMRSHDQGILSTKLKRFQRASIDESQFFDIESNWDSVLKDAGAVSWSNTNPVAGKAVEAWLQADIDRFQGNPVQAKSIAEAMKYQRGSPARCLCNGDKPIEGYAY